MQIPYNEKLRPDTGLYKSAYPPVTTVVKLHQILLIIVPTDVDRCPSK